MGGFNVDDAMTGDIERIIRRAKTNKFPGLDGFHNEMLKIELKLMAEVLADLWRLIGRTKMYPDKWKRGLVTPVFKKGDLILPQHYWPLCIMQHA